MTKSTSTHSDVVIRMVAQLFVANCFEARSHFVVGFLCCDVLFHLSEKRRLSWDRGMTRIRLGNRVGQRTSRAPFPSRLLDCPLEVVWWFFSSV